MKKFGTLTMAQEDDGRVYVVEADDLIGISPDLLVNNRARSPFKLSQRFFGDWIVNHDGDEVYVYTPLYWDHASACLVLRRIHHAT